MSFAWRSCACLALWVAGDGFSCSTSASLQGAGGACAVATDCDNGYVCIHGVCTSDLDAIAKTEVDSGSRDATMTPPPSDGGGSTSPDSTSGNADNPRQDAGVPMPADAAGD